MFFIISLGELIMKKYTVTLTKDEREALDALTSKGKHKSQKILNALILLGCDEGEYQEETSTNEAQSTFPVMRLEAGYILPKVFSLWNEVPSGTPNDSHTP
jgi:hypothetical protein